MRDVKHIGQFTRTRQLNPLAPLYLPQWFLGGREWESARGRSMTRMRSTSGERRDSWARDSSEASARAFPNELFFFFFFGH